MILFRVLFVGSLLSVVGCSSYLTATIFAGQDDGKVFKRRPNKEGTQRNGSELETAGPQNETSKDNGKVFKRRPNKEGTRRDGSELETAGSQDEAGEDDDPQLEQLAENLKRTKDETKDNNEILEELEVYLIWLKKYVASGNESVAKQLHDGLDKICHDEIEKASNSDRTRAAVFCFIRGQLQSEYKPIGNSKKAIQYLEQALNYDPDPSWKWKNHFLLAEIYNASEETEKAEGHYREAIKLNAFLISAELALAKIYFDGGEIEKGNERMCTVISHIGLTGDWADSVSRQNEQVLFFRDQIKDGQPANLVELLHTAEDCHESLSLLLGQLIPPTKLSLYLRDTADGGIVELRFVYVPPGIRYIGFDNERREEGGLRLKKEGDSHFSFFGIKSNGLHQVSLQEGFYILDREVTRRQWQAVLKEYAAKIGPENSKNADKETLDLPIGNISWKDAMIFCRLLEREVGIACQLPTEWEWECAARQNRDDYFPWGPEYLPIERELKPLDESECSDVTATRIFQLAGSLKEWCRNEHSNSIDIGQSLPVEQATVRLDLKKLALVESERRIPNTRLMSVRGGSYDEEFTCYCQSPVRSARNIADSALDLGFRPILLLRKAEMWGDD